MLMSVNHSSNETPREPYIGGKAAEMNGNGITRLNIPLLTASYMLLPAVSFIAVKVLEGER